MKGVIRQGQKLDYACFKCIHCNEVHCLYISQNDPQNLAGLYVWKYRYLDKNTIELTPSYDNSKFCGWHGPYIWTIELVSQEEWKDFIDGNKNL